MERTETPSDGSLPVQFRLDISVTAGNPHEFELLRSGMSPLFAMDAATVRDRRSFQTSMTSHQFADIAISSSSASASTYERTKQTIACNAVDYIGLLVYTQGGCRLDVEGRSSEIHPGDVCIFDMTRPSAVRASDFADISVILPRALVEPQLANPDLLHGQILVKSSPLNALLVSQMKTWFAQSSALTVAEARAAAQGATSLIAAFAGASALGRENIRKAAAATSLQYARRIVEANLHDRNFGPEAICRQLGMSRSKLYRLFEMAGGVGNYILQRRMTRAYRSLIDPTCAHERVGTIAAQCGFSNVSVFSRAFRQAHGMSPKELRDACVSADVADGAASLDNDFAAMRRWLLGPNGAD